jgi:predicted MFS family arabinose efflux permease
VTSRWATLSTLIAGPRASRRLALTHAIDDVADAMINLSLVGSLFFSVSLEASRTRILGYLLLTAAPLALAAPVVGPLLDRSRAGYRTLLAITQLMRVGLALALAGSLLSLSFYPIVFGILLSRKAYALVKTALLAQLCPDRVELVRASGHVARTGTVAGGIGTGIAGIVLALVGPSVLPVIGAVGFLIAAFVSFTIPVPTSTVIRHRLTASEQRRWFGGMAPVPPQVRSASFAVASLSAGSGALTFLLAFAIKRGGGDAWIFVVAIVAAGTGAFLGTLIAPALHRRLSSDRVIVTALLIPGTVAALGVLVVGYFGIVILALAMGTGISVSARAMDGLYGKVPAEVRGRTISSSELRFQIAQVMGATPAVLFLPAPRVGFGVVAVVLVLAGVVYASHRGLSLRHEAAALLLGERRTVSDDFDES